MSERKIQHRLSPSNVWSKGIAGLLDYAKFFNGSHDAVIRVYDEAGNVIETHEHADDFKEWYGLS
jgi:hypothetical protein